MKIATDPFTVNDEEPLEPLTKIRPFRDPRFKMPLETDRVSVSELVPEPLSARVIRVTAGRREGERAVLDDGGRRRLALTISGLAEMALIVSETLLVAEEAVPGSWSNTVKVSPPV